MVETTVRYRINRDRCTGCCECLRVCKDHAIRKITSELCAKCAKYCSFVPSDQLQCGQNKMCIDEDACTGCGRCAEICPSDAVVPLEAGVSFATTMHTLHADAR